MSQVHQSIHCSGVRAAAALLAFCLTLAGASFVQAETKEYGPEWQRYTIDVPEGWTEQASETEGGEPAVMLVSPDGRAALSIRVCPREGRSAEALARETASNLSVSSIRKLDENTRLLYVTSENIRLRNIVKTAGSAVIVISAGGDPEATQEMLASFTPLEP